MTNFVIAVALVVCIILAGLMIWSVLADQAEGADSTWTPKRFKPPETKTYWDRSYDEGPVNAAGHRINVSRETMKLLEIIDTAVFTNGVAELTLSTTPSSGVKRTAPTDTSRITINMTFPDSGVVLSDHDFSGDMRKLTLVASDTTFDGRVQVVMRVR